MDYGVYHNRGGFLSPSRLSPTYEYYNGQLAVNAGGRNNFHPIMFAENAFADDAHHRSVMNSPDYGYANNMYGGLAHQHPLSQQPMGDPPLPDVERFMRYPHRPLTKSSLIPELDSAMCWNESMAKHSKKAHSTTTTTSNTFGSNQVNQMAYELPSTNRNHRQPNYRKQPWGCSAPEFLKVFGDVTERPGGRVVLDCVLLGSPRPRVSWLFNDDERLADWPDVMVEDTADLCRLTISQLARHHYGVYTVVAENEVGHAVTRAAVRPPPGGI